MQTFENYATTKPVSQIVNVLDWHKNRNFVLNRVGKAENCVLKSQGFEWNPPPSPPLPPDAINGACQ